MSSLFKKLVIAFVSLFILSYLVWSFSLWEINAGNWTSNDRAGMVSTWALLCFISVGFIIMND